MYTILSRGRIVLSVFRERSEPPWGSGAKPPGWVGGHAAQPRGVQGIPLPGCGAAPHKAARRTTLRRGSPIASRARAGGPPPTAHAQLRQSPTRAQLQRPPNPHTRNGSPEGRMTLWQGAGAAPLHLPQQFGLLAFSSFMMWTMVSLVSLIRKQASLRHCSMGQSSGFFAVGMVRSTWRSIRHSFGSGRSGHPGSAAAEAP